MKKILVVLADGGMGDLILATPVIKSLKEELRADFMAVLVSFYTRDIVSENPYVDEVLVDIDPSDCKKRAPFFYLLSKIRKYKFDCAVVLWSTARFAWLIYLAGIPLRVGQDFRLLYSFLYTHRVPLRTLRGDRESHWVECLMDFARQIGAGKEEPEVCLPVSSEAKKEVRAILERNNIFDDNILIGIHPGRGIDLSGVSWPYELFARTGDALERLFGAKVVFTGGKGEVQVAKKIISSMKTSPVNMAGICNLKQLIALIDSCDLFISIDSGPMHIAAARNIPVVAIFALKSDMPFRWGPYKTRHFIVRKDVSCQELCIKEKCTHFSCMHELDPEDIIEPVKMILKDK